MPHVFHSRQQCFFHPKTLVPNCKCVTASMPSVLIERPPDATATTTLYGEMSVTRRSHFAFLMLRDYSCQSAVVRHGRTPAYPRYIVWGVTRLLLFPSFPRQTTTLSLVVRHYSSQGAIGKWALLQRPGPELRGSGGYSLRNPRISQAR